MKPISIVILLTLVSASCCQKNKNNITTNPSASAMLNGTPWLGDNIICELRDNSKVLFIIEKNSLDNNQQSINLHNVALMNGEHSIYGFTDWVVFDERGSKRGSDSCTGGGYISRYDITENTYHVLDSENNYINIEDYQTSSPRLKGSFQITFVRSTALGKPPTQGLGDTLRFTNGTFDVNIQKGD